MSRQKIGKMTTWKKNTTQEQSSAEGGGLFQNIM